MSLIGPGFVQVCLSARPSARHYSSGLPQQGFVFNPAGDIWQKSYHVGQLVSPPIELHLIDSWFPLIHPQTDFLARALRDLIEKSMRHFPNNSEFHFQPALL